MEGGYLRRLRERNASSAARKSAVFGQVGGLILLALGGFRYLFTITKGDALWLGLAIAGGLLIITATAAPVAVRPIERAFVWLAHKIGLVIFGTILGAVFYLLVSPVGILLRWRRGKAPFFAWVAGRETPPAAVWHRKKLETDDRAVSSAAERLSLPLQGFALLGYFIRNRNFVFLPLLCILIVIGLLLFFLKTSSLAPFIYTLF